MNRKIILKKINLAALAGALLLPSAGFGQSTTIKGMTLVSTLREGIPRTAGIWGWKHPETGVEYALPSNGAGVAVVSLENPAAPKLLHSLASPSGTWHELLTIGTFLYKCAEQGSVGMQVWDLSPLPAAPTPGTNFTGVSTCHSLWGDSLATPHPRVYVEGSGDVRIVSLENPAKPVQIGRIAGSAHDGMARANRVYISQSGGVSIVDATNPAATTRLGRIEIRVASALLGEGSAGYSHNVWLTNDNKYAITTEETNNKTVKMWDITDVAAPKFTGATYLTGTSMAHNIYVRNNVAYLSDYGDGIRILDIRDPSKFTELGYHDPGGSSWGCYPWLPSGLIIHGNGGLRVLRPDPAIIALGGNPVSVKPGDHYYQFIITSMNRSGIKFQLPKDGKYGLSIYSAAGKQVLEMQRTGNAGAQSLDFQAGKLAGGQYLLRLSQGSSEFSAPISIGN